MDVIRWSPSRDTNGAPKLSVIRALVRSLMEADPDWDAVGIVSQAKAACERAQLVYDSAAIYAAISGARRQLEHMQRRRSA